MHEMSLCEGILQLLESEASKQKASRINKVWVEVGQLTCVEAEALKFCYDMVVANSVAHGSKLVIESIAGRAWCERCQTHVGIEELYSICDHCGNSRLEITNGEELRVKEMEIE